MQNDGVCILIRNGFLNSLMNASILSRWQGRSWAIVFTLLGLVVSLTAQDVTPKSVILFIGDGMGFEHVKAARCYNGASLSFESLPYQGQVTTYSANNAVTDSAASGTAIATGVKVNNYTVSIANPGDGSDLQTTLEFYQTRGKKVGLVTTTYLTHATPATFGAHAADRNSYTEIASDYLSQTKPNILFGGGGNGLTTAATIAAGYQVATDIAGFDDLALEDKSYISAQFGTTFMPYEADQSYESYPYPHLSEMVAKALNELDPLRTDPNGFFLMVEGGMIDQACHDNNLEQSIHETLELSRAVKVALDWAAGRNDTLILVTADHETGGLVVTQDNGPGVYPNVTWSTTGHTAANVPAYAWGMHAGRVTGVLDNTDIHRICTGKPIPVNVTLVAAGSTWKYEASGADLGTDWRAAGYSDTGWPYGPAQLGYGDGDETTIIPKTSPVYPCYYFRHHFSIDDRTAYDALSLRILRDDGAIVYLNGVEVARYNMPAGDVTYNTLASSASEFGWDAAVSIDNLLIAGDNVLAVEVHQGNSTSSDLSLDLELKAVRTAPDTTAPMISNVAIEVTDISAVVTWDTDEPSDSEVIYEIVGSNDPSTAIVPALVTQHSVQITGLEPETAYSYQVSSADAAGNLRVSEIGNFTTSTFDNDPPSAPVLTAVAGDGLVSLSWTVAIDPDGGTVSYSVYRTTNEEDYEVLTSEAIPTIEYTDTTALNGTTYSYIVRAHDAQNDPAVYADSDSVTATPTKPDYNAYVNQNPSMLSGTMSGDYSNLKGASDGSQTLSETKIGLYGQLEAQYTLQTIATPAEINGCTLILNATTTTSLDDGLWNVLAWNGTEWQQVCTFGIGITTVEIPLDSSYVAANGIIQIAITDGADLRKEKLDSVAIDQLYVSIATGPANQAPSATADSYSTQEDTAVTLGVLDNDTDPDGGTLSAVLVAGPTHGTLALNSDGSFTYTPSANFNGVDSFTYKASDGLAESKAATVTITVTAVNDAPVALAQTVSAVKDTPVTITLVGTDVDGDPLNYDYTQPSYGTLSESELILIYTPAPGYTGPDSFTFTVNDGTVDSESATVTITVTEASPTPVIHIQRIDLAVVPAGKNVKATATVRIVDQAGLPFSGATVSGGWDFNGNPIGTASGVSDANGMAVISSAPVKASSGTFAFTVTNVTASGADYDSSTSVTTGSITFP